MSDIYDPILDGESLYQQTFAPGSTFIPDREQVRAILTYKKSQPRLVKKAVEAVLSPIDTLKKAAGGAYDFVAEPAKAFGEYVGTPSADQSEGSNAPKYIDAALEAGAQNARGLFNMPGHLIPPDLQKAAIRAQLSQMHSLLGAFGVPTTRMTDADVEYQNFLDDLKESRKSERLATGQEFLLPGIDKEEAPLVKALTPFADPTLLIPGARGLKAAEAAGSSLASKALEGTAKVLKEVGAEAPGQVLEQVGKTVATPSRLSVAERIAGNQEIPKWIRSLAAFRGVEAASRVAESTAPAVLSATKSAGVGAGFSYAAENPAKTEADKAEGAIAGAGVGLGAHGIGRGIGYALEPRVEGQKASNRAREKSQNLADFNEMVKYLRSRGTPEEVLGRIKDDPAWQTAILTASHARGLAKNSIDVDFMGGDNFNQVAGPAGRNTAAFFDGKRVVLNVDANDPRALLHELPHAVQKALGADAEVALLIKSMLTQDQIQRAKWDYASRLATDMAQTESAVALEPTIRRIIFDKDGAAPNWIYNEIFADAGRAFLYEGLGQRPRDFLTEIRRTPTLASIVETLKGPAANFARRLGAEAWAKYFDALGYPPVDSPASVGALFRDPQIYSSPTIRAAYTRLWQKLRASRLGIRSPTPLRPKTIGMHESMPLEEDGLGRLGNDWVVQEPGSDLALRPGSETQGLRRQREAEIKQSLPENTPLSYDQVVGTLNASQNWLGESKRSMAELLQAAQKDEIVRVWYTSEGSVGPQSIRLDISPFEFFRTPAGVLSVRVIDWGAFDHKLKRWAADPSSPLFTHWEGNLSWLWDDIFSYLDDNITRSEEPLLRPERVALVSEFVLGRKICPNGKNPLQVPGPQTNDSITRVLRADGLFDARRTPVRWYSQAPGRELSEPPVPAQAVQQRRMAEAASMVWGFEPQDQVQYSPTPQKIAYFTERLGGEWLPEEAGALENLQRAADIDRRFNVWMRSRASGEDKRPSIHVVNQYLRNHPEEREALKSLGNSALVTEEGLLRPTPIETNLKPDGKPEFGGFSRSIAQLFLDRLDPAVYETIRQKLHSATLHAYEESRKSGDFTLPSPLRILGLNKGKGTSIASVEGEAREFRVQTPIRTAQKTLAALSLNSACPMFTIGGRGCWGDACYLTQMGHGGNSVNLFERAMYTGEILQLSDAEVAALNDIGGLRINGVGDTTPDNVRQLHDVFTDAKRRGLQLKLITKQELSFAAIHEAKAAGVPVDHVIVQPSLDYYWRPVELDLNNPESGMNVMGLKNALAKDNGAAIQAAYSLFGRDVRKIEGKWYRKDGLSWDQLAEMRQKYPEVQVIPRLIVGSVSEIIDGAIRHPDAILTWMHGKLGPGIVSEMPGQQFNFLSSRHKFGWDGRKQQIIVEADKSSPDEVGAHKPVVQTRGHIALQNYINSRFSPEDRKTIYQNLKRQTCCQENDSPDACASCASHCALRTVMDGKNVAEKVVRFGESPEARNGF